MEEYVGELLQLRSEMAGIKKNQEREISELKEEYSRQIEEVRLGLLSIATKVAVNR